MRREASLVAPAAEALARQLVSVDWTLPAVVDESACKAGVEALYRLAELPVPLVRVAKDPGEVVERPAEASRGGIRASAIGWPRHPGLTRAESAALSTARQAVTNTLDVSKDEVGGLRETTRRSLRGAFGQPLLPLAARGVAYRAVAEVLMEPVRRSQRQKMLLWGDACAKLVAAGGWLIWPFEHEAMVLARPAVLCVGEELHREDGPAIIWPSGRAWWYWQNWRVPRNAVECPERLDPFAHILWERNLLLRRVLLERYGMAQFIREVHVRPADIGPRGILWFVHLPGDEALCVVEVINATPEPDGRHEHHFLRVPPSMRTAAQAVAWTFGLAAAEYHPEIQT